MNRLEDLYKADLLQQNIESGEITWQSPSNIALVKYWGKHGNQLPMNPSVSFTLKKSFTETTLKYKPSINGRLKFYFFLDGKHKPQFETKLSNFFNKIIDIFPFLNQVQLEIYSKNTFPHSSGIASSASGMSALALCLCSLEQRLFKVELVDSEFFKKASYVSRIGSGSAARSVYGGLVSWGMNKVIASSSDYFATDLTAQINPVFTNFQDSIILISSDEKKVSSTIGHGLMNNHPFADSRFLQAKNNYNSIVSVLKSGDLDRFIGIVENEAMSLHAMMMTSNPGYFLFEPNTLHAIKRIISFRERSKLPICFTLDAGPNIHLLYPESIKLEVNGFIHEELLIFSNQKKVIFDEVGNGPNIIKKEK